MRAEATRPELSQFHELANYYDPLNDWKDYRRESERLESIVRRVVGPGKKSWLDVACGTGRHLEFLSRRHATVGVDGSTDMLRIARRRLQGTRLVLGDMRTFHLRQQFDVVSCLFSAIGHMRTKADVRRTFANFERHLRPGGIAILEPWIAPSEFHPGFLHLRTHEDPNLSAVRLAYSTVRGKHSIVRFHYLIGEPGRGVRYLEVKDVGLLLAKDELTQLMREAGLRARFLSRGLMSGRKGRGLIIGIKS
jgi:ubiquinone/menaquinone biosynthesis C-methylase UbiE